MAQVGDDYDGTLLLIRVAEIYRICCVYLLGTCYPVLSLESLLITIGKVSGTGRTRSGADGAY